MIVYINAVYFRLFIDLMHITPPVTAEGYDGSHHPRYAEWEKVLTFITTTKLNYLWSSFSYYTVRLDTSSLYKKKNGSQQGSAMPLNYNYSCFPNNSKLENNTTSHWLNQIV